MTRKNKKYGIECCDIEDAQPVGKCDVLIAGGCLADAQYALRAT